MKAFNSVRISQELHLISEECVKLDNLSALNDEAAICNILKQIQHQMQQMQEQQQQMQKQQQQMQEQLQQMQTQFEDRFDRFEVRLNWFETKMSALYMLLSLKPVIAYMC